ncbi:hypothetical protein KI688_007491 [Linnemannia hyalina]|uniref:MICOS complex subunit n=1 Tax=Linnemannia hyalina TaxID=64524 RepID=A0A9P7XJ96_9FUNG|nr:hypothetical protein KI688_007491 [Linnemannia hyalina]
MFRVSQSLKVPAPIHQTGPPEDNNRNGMAYLGCITKSLVAIGASVGLLVSTSGAVALAEGKERKQKLPIYDEPEPEMMIKEEPTRLDEALRVARKETDRQILGMKYHLKMVTNKVVDLEKEAEVGTIKSVLVKEEDVMPAALYVVVAGFAGSIFASRRNIMLRFLTPVAFSAMAFGYFFPASSNRLIAQANNSDFSKYIPKDVQNQIRDLTNTASSTISSATSSAVSQESKLTKAVEEIKHSAQEVKEAFEKTSVQEKLEESVSVAKETVEDVKEKVAEIKKSVVEKVEVEKTKTEKTAEENNREERLRKIREEDSLKRV